ncbi:MAG TPA: VWA domain-containing protein [Actinoplanes sp.]|jgi:Ca-activated chloride channel family protein|nr:VWA domain-containing protein [Actinoplanes sp.]
MAIVLVLAGSWFGYQQLSAKGCSGQIKLSVAAATEIAPAVDQAAQQWITDGANVNGTCVAVNVSAVNPATMAAAVAREHKVSLIGLGPAPASVAVPDVWLPDSSTWLLRLKSEATGFLPTDGTSIAESPVVLAMPSPVARLLGWPNKSIGWKDLLGQMASSNAFKPGIVDPTRDAAGLSGLIALGSAAGNDVAGAQKKVGALRALAAGSSSIREDLLQKFPRAGDPNDIANSLAAAPLSEEDVVAYNAEKPSVELAALYVEPTPPALDYPFTVMPEVDLKKSAAAAGLRQVLRKASFRNALASAGLRGPDGAAGAGFAAPIGAPAASPRPAVPADGGAAGAARQAGAINQLLGSWAAITLPGRALAVFDISGSMLTKVPTAGGLTRAQVTQGAAAQGLALFDDRWAVGTWVFSTDLVGKRAWREVVPITPLSSGRTRLQATIGQITPKKNGDTGLYDTALAAYKTVQDSWEPGRVNSVILFTDGKNENKDGISREYLLSQLKKLQDPKRPVRMVIIGIGNEVDRNELEAITNATSAGGVFIAPDPAKIADIFLQAIAQRTGA